MVAVAHGPERIGSGDLRWRTQSLAPGNLNPRMGQDVDLLAISTNGLSDESHHDIVVKELKSCDGLKLASIAKAVDLKGSLLNSWMSQPLELNPAANKRVNQRANSHFQRVAGCGRGRVQKQDQKPMEHGIHLTALFVARGPDDAKRSLPYRCCSIA